MRSMRSYRAVILFGLLSPAFAQNVSSTIKGMVQDATKAAIVGAACTLTNPATSASFTTKTGSDGSFIFLDVQAGTYSLAIHAAGFKAFQEDGIVVTASEFRALGNLTLQIGQAAESVTVTAETAPVQTSSGEKSDVVTGDELSDMAVKGRDFVSLLATIPGIIDTASDTRDSFTRNALGGIHINGGRDTQALMVVDGMPSMDAGNNGPPEEPNMDSIQEVKVLTASYQAEYGRNGGGSVIVVSKTGTNQLHGSAYDYYRDEELDANNFFNNKTDSPRQPYRYRMTGYSLGGPVLIPKHASLTRNKLFFFFSQELLGSKVNYTPQLTMTPSALERQGNFSKSFNTNGALIKVNDPLNNKIQFPGNIIPPSRIDPMGSNILNIFPLPNYVDPDPKNLYQYNYRSMYAGGWPRRQELGRIDTNFWPSLQIYYRVMDDFDKRLLPFGSGGWPAGSVNFLLTPIIWDRPARMHTVHATKTFTPTLVNEFTIGKSYNAVWVSPVDPSMVERSRIGNIPELYPHSGPGTGFVPNVTFGGTPVHAVNMTLDANLPEVLPDDALVISDNLSKVWRNHQLKFGVYFERNRKQQPASVDYRGAFAFGNDANNPLDSGNGFSNALLGNYNTYTEATNYPTGDYRFINVEWYVQDNWKVSRRLTLDLGLRLYHVPPTVDASHTVSTMDPAYYDLANAPVLYQGYKNSANQRVALNPLTGQQYPVSLIGLYVPGTGNPVNGMRVGGVNGYPGGLFTSPWLGFGPRFGFAYDLFGNGRTAIRGGFGSFKDRVQGNLIYNTAGNPPVTLKPTLYYGNIESLAQAQSLNGPSNITEDLGHSKLPSIMNYNFGIQQEVRHTLVDVSYVGALSRHLPLGQNMNPIPEFAYYLPQYKDPSQTNSHLPDNFMRPYLGYGTITVYHFMGTTNYNSLQASVRRRLNRGMQISGAYTFGKALGTASTDTEGISSYMSPRFWNYGPLTYSRTQSFVCNYVYDLPRVGKRLGFRPAELTLDGWQLSGITTFQTGAPFTPGFTTTDGANISGSSDGARVLVVGNPKAAAQPGYFYNTAAFGRPAPETFGNAGTNVVYGPGVNNWDISVGRRFRPWSERSSMLFRTELFNAWNHTQFSSTYNTARFNPQGQQTDSTFGQFSAARSARIIQLSVRAVF